MSRSTLYLLTLCVLISQYTAAQSSSSIIGKWKTIDDRTGKARAIVDIYENDGKVYGKIIKTYPLPGEDPEPVCDKCEGVDKDKPIIGMDIIRDMEKNRDSWDEGTILDAETGRTYSCNLWLEDARLMVRGYVAFFYRTQEWLPHNE